MTTFAQVWKSKRNTTLTSLMLKVRYLLVYANMSNSHISKLNSPSCKGFSSEQGDVTSRCLDLNCFTFLKGTKENEATTIKSQSIFI